MTDWSRLRHAHGEASDLGPLLAAACQDDVRACMTAVNAIRERVFHQGSVYESTGPAVAALGAALVPGRGDPNVVSCMFLLDVLRGTRGAMLRARSTGGGGSLSAIDAAFQAMQPALKRLRESDDILEQCWAIYLLAWMPDEVPGLHEEELARLETAEHPMLYLTSAQVVADREALHDALLEHLASWLEAGGDRARAAAMLWAETRGHPKRPEATPDAVFRVLIELAAGERWGEWDGLPSHRGGYFADLATHLLVAGYVRAPESVPALFTLLERCNERELGHVAQTLLKVVYQSAPYPGAPTLDVLTPLQRDALERLARCERVWRDPLDVAVTLSELDLPLDPRGLLRFLERDGEVAPPEMRVTGVRDGVVSLDTELTPAEVLKRLEE